MIAIKQCCLHSVCCYTWFENPAHHHAQLHLRNRLVILAHAEQKGSERLSVNLCFPVELQTVGADCQHNPAANVHLVEAIDVQGYIHSHLCRQLLQPVHKLPARQVNLLQLCLVGLRCCIDCIPARQCRHTHSEQL